MRITHERKVSDTPWIQPQVSEFKLTPLGQPPDPAENGSSFLSTQRNTSESYQLSQPEGLVTNPAPIQPEQKVTFTSIPDYHTSLFAFIYVVAINEDLKIYLKILVNLAKSFDFPMVCLNSSFIFYQRHF